MNTYIFQQEVGPGRLKIARYEALSMDAAIEDLSGTGWALIGEIVYEASCRFHPDMVPDYNDTRH